MIITLDSISGTKSAAKIAAQLQFLFHKLEIECLTIADKNIMDVKQLDQYLLTYKKNKIFLLVCLDNKVEIKSEMMINSHLVCSFADDFINDIEKIAITNDKKYELVKPGSYSDFVWEQKKIRAEYTRKTFDWTIYKNYSSVYNKGFRMDSEIILRKIARKIGAKVEQGVTNIASLEQGNLFSIQSPNIHQVVAKQEILNIAKSFRSEIIQEQLFNKKI
ncbi:MAG: division plane positioning ATPase MipZ [Rickettsiales bacterium]